MAPVIIADLSSQSFASSPRPTKRARLIKPLPESLLDHATVCFEEGLYTQALSVLSSALFAGHTTNAPAYLPPAQLLSLAATLSVHPSLTTRTLARDKHAAADDSLRYLSLVLALTGSQDACFANALQFHRSTPTHLQTDASRKQRTRARPSPNWNGDTEEQQDLVHSVFAGKEGLANCVDDFWSVVGWALNCSVVHRRRWTRWQPYLSLMLDILEDDLETRSRVGTVTDSLLARYLYPIGEGRGNKRRLMRALLADGKQKSLAEFGEVWKNETKPPKQPKEHVRSTKRRKLDLENGEFGDYFDDNSDLDSPEGSSRRSRSATAVSSKRQSRAPSPTQEADASDDAETYAGARVMSDADDFSGIRAFGGMGSIHLRQRFLALLTSFSAHAPAAFLDTEDLFDLFTEFLRPLPLPVFQHFVLPCPSYMGLHSQASLNLMLLRPLLASVAPAYNENALRQHEFETHYAPFAANSTGVVDNAKVSLLLESLLRGLWNRDGLIGSVSLTEAVEKGIEAREVQVANDGRRRTGARAREADDAEGVLLESGERIMDVLAMIE